MANANLERRCTAIGTSIANNAAITAAIDMRDYAGGIVMVPTSWTDANIGFYVSDAFNGTYVILRDDTGVPIQISTILTSAARAYAMPDKVFAAPYVKLWSKNTTAATETDTNQSGAKALTLLLKS